MAIVNILIRNNSYQIACNDGEEDNLLRLADNFASRINKLSASYAKAGDNLLLVIAALTAESELEDLRKRRHQLPLNGFEDKDKKTTTVDASVSEAIDAISEYVENLARKINNL